MMTPTDIEALLRCAIHTATMVGPHNIITLTPLLQKGLIVLVDESSATYGTTDKGDAHIRQMCNLALPVPVWGDADGKIIKPHNQGE